MSLSAMEKCRAGFSCSNVPARLAWERPVDTRTAGHGAGVMLLAAGAGEVPRNGHELGSEVTVHGPCVQMS